MLKKILIAALLASGLELVAAPALAQDYGYRNAPPPPHQEYVPAARPGYVFAPGHWERQNNRYVWVKGTYIRERRGHEFVPAHWEQRGRRWHFVEATWQPRMRDRDRDGIPNRADRDRDNDGVANANDRWPNDPRYY